MKGYILFFIVVIFITHNTKSFASCTNSDLSGAWELYGTIIQPSNLVAIPFRCSIKMPLKGIAIKAGSICDSVGSEDGMNFSSTVLLGDLTVDSKCHVTGYILINMGKRGATLDSTGINDGINLPVGGNVDVERKIESKVDAFISKGKDSISGMMYEGTFTPPILSNGISQAIINGSVIGGTLPQAIINQQEFTSSSIFTAIKL